MRLVIAALVTFLCATLSQAAAESSLTKRNNDASLRGHGAPGIGGPSFYRRHSYPRQPRRGGQRPRINGPDAKGTSADPF